MGDVFERRRTNLRHLIEQWGGPLHLSQKIGYRNASFLVQMAGPNPNREVTERTARRVEEALGLPPRWMDSELGSMPNGHPAVDSRLVGRAAQVVAQTAEEGGLKLSPSLPGDLVALVYADAEAHGGSIRADFVDNLLKLIR